jgi:hypothetical protein
MFSASIMSQMRLRTAHFQAPATDPGAACSTAPTAAACRDIPAIAAASNSSRFRS